MITKEIEKPNNITKELSLKSLIGGGYKEFFFDKHFYRVIKGSRGSKKSKTIALNHIYRLLIYEWSNILVVRRHSNTLRQSCYTELKWAIAQLGVNDYFKCNPSLPEITYIPTGQKILFRGLDDPLKITSIAVETGILAFVWIEECYEIESAEKLETLAESIRGKYDNPEVFRQITLSFNPWSEKHWLKREFFDEETKKKNVSSYTTNYRVNEWLDQETIDRYEDLYRTNPKRARVVCDGDWGIADGLVFENFREAEMTADELKGYKPIQGIDYGWSNDPTAFIAAYVNEKEKKLYVSDEFYQTHLKTEDIANLIKGKGYQDDLIMSEVDGRLINELFDCGIRRMQQVVKDKVVVGIVELQNYEIIINPKCSDFLVEINNYTWKKEKLSDRYLGQPIDAYNHLIDALRYAMTSLHVGVSLDIRESLF